MIKNWATTASAPRDIVISYSDGDTEVRSAGHAITWEEAVERGWIVETEVQATDTEALRDLRAVCMLLVDEIMLNRPTGSGLVDGMALVLTDAQRESLMEVEALWKARFFERTRNHNPNDLCASCMTGLLHPIGATTLACDECGVTVDPGPPLFDGDEV